ncbi:MAG TPA: bifunctional 4-hydroxy-2-oxoglutarate aldolase/2-dehydro-3-deoxy-phosphogluconate aldolase [Coleofasciculaceae cyanobacterium]
MLNAQCPISRWLQLLRQHKAIAVIRCCDPNLAHKMALAVAEGGMNLIEITWNNDCPGDLISQLRSQLPQCTIGAGTIINLHQLQEAVMAGAQFAFAPHFDPTLLEASLSHYKIPFVPGVFSPTEVVNAWQQGARVVKIFPIESLGGAKYIKCLQGPLSHIPLIPTGGITLDNAQSMIEAGAIAVGISSNLFLQEAIVNQDWSNITTRTEILLNNLQAAP